MSTKTIAKSTSKTQEPAKTSVVTNIRDKAYENQSGYTQWLRQKYVFGYLHSVREIPNSFPQRIGATISVPQGEVRDWETYQVIVNSYDAHMLFNDYKTDVEDKDTNVTIRFDVTNIKSKHYIVEEGENKGNIVDYTDATLNNISSMSVDGNVVYSQEHKISMSAKDYHSQTKV